MKRKKAFLIAYRKLKVSRIDFDNYIDEMKELARSVKIDIIEVFEQTGVSCNPKTYLNRGKIEAVQSLAKAHNVDFIIGSEELTPLQYKNLCDIFPTEVVDRAELIFWIFRENAKTHLGKYKVELAQLQYEITRIAGQGKTMSRTGGGIGTRGLGEQKKELDKRYITKRIKSLKEKIEKEKKGKKERRKNRKGSGIPIVTLVGYTNVGKTSLLNALIKNNKGYVRDKYFATLEPQTKKLFLDSENSVLISDSVGFISELPEKLFEAFISTIEEISFSDILILVLSPYMNEAEKQLEIIKNTLKKIDSDHKPIIIIHNKCDLVEEKEYPFVSAKKRINIEPLKKQIRKAIEKQ